MSRPVADCPFCLESGLLRVPVLAKSDQAFLIEAVTSPGRYFINPLEHYESLDELPDTWWADVKRLLAEVPELGGTYNLSINIGQIAGQRLKHLHFWVIPRIDGKASSGRGLAALLAEVDGE